MITLPMTEITTLIIHCLRACYWLEIATLELLPLGADRNASVYKAESTDHKVYFVKIRRGSSSEVHMEVIALLQQTGIKEIISPITTREGKQLQQMGAFTLIVYPFVEGKNGFSHSLSDEQWIQFGKTLRRIHEIEVPPTIQKRIHQEDFTPKWRDTVRSLYNPIEGENDEVGTRFKNFLIEKKKVIEQLLNRADQLSKKLETQSFPFVLCHSDLHAGNLLLEKEDIFYLIDWDDPIMAPKERDLMFIGGGVGNVWNRSHEGTLFYKGYGQTEVNQILLAYYRHERILQDIAEFAEELLFQNNTKDKAEMYGHFIAMFESDGVVDIALQMEIPQT